MDWIPAEPIVLLSINGKKFLEEVKKLLLVGFDPATCLGSLFGAHRTGKTGQEKPDL